MTAPNVRTRRQRRNPGQLSEVTRATDIDQFTKVMLHLNGANGSTTFTDVTGKVWSSIGTPQISTGASIFGGASMIVTSTTATPQGITTPNHADFQLATDSWTLDFWFRIASVTNNIPIFTKRGGAGNDSFVFQYLSGTTRFRFNWTETGTTFVGPADFVLAGSLGVGLWVPFCLIRDTTNLRLYMNGIQVGSDFNIGSSSIFAGTAVAQVGSSVNQGGDYTAYFDEVRFSKGIVRDFTPASVEFS